jgi:hypothetical protein
MKTDLKYRTFDDLLAEVAIDFHVYNNEGMIEPAQLIKVAQKINYDLGLRIHKTKERILDIEHGKAKLPDDFYVMSYATLCGAYTVKQRVMQGRQVEEVIVNPDEMGDTCTSCHLPEQSCPCEKTYMDTCGNTVKLIEKRKYETREYKIFTPIKFKPGKYLAQNCVNVSQGAVYEAEIKNGFVYTNLQTGTLYISYEGAMEDDEGNLLVLDHPMINEYYEYALKKRILENLAMNGEDVIQRMNIITPELRAARNYALTIVNTPDYAELQNIWEMNRKAQYRKYYQMFTSIPPQV